MQGSEFQVDIDLVTSHEWSQLLDLFEDANFYQTWPYGAVRWGRGNLSHLVLRRNGEAVGIAQLRIIRPTKFNLGIAYLRWGPLCHRRGRELDRNIVSHTIRALQQEYVTKRRLLLEILPNVAVGSSRDTPFRCAFTGFTQEPRTHANTYRTFILDLAPTLDELRRNLDAKWRNKLTQAEKKDLKVILDNSADGYQTFCRLYAEMRKRKAFETTVDVQQFGRIQEHLLGTHRLQTLICEQDGAPVAGLVASAMGNSGIYLLGATSDSGLSSKGAYLLQWTLIRWLKENGVRWYDLGGIDPDGNQGVYQFKRGLSGTDSYLLSPFVASNRGISSTIIRTTLTAYRVVRNLRVTHLGRALIDACK